MKRAGLPISVAYASFGKSGLAVAGPGFHRQRNAQSRSRDGFPAPAIHRRFVPVLRIPAHVPVSASARAKFVELDPLSRSMLPWTDEDIDNYYRMQWSKLDAKKWRETWNREIQTR